MAKRDVRPVEDDLEKIVRLYHQLLVEDDESKRKAAQAELTTLAGDVHRRLADLKEFTENLKVKRVRKGSPLKNFNVPPTLKVPALAAGDSLTLTGAVDPTEDAPEGEVTDIFDFKEFFEDIADAYVHTSQELNAKSLEYAGNVPPGIEPAYFAIPSVKAEMKVGFQKSAGKGFNVFFFNRTKKQSDFGDQKISFELVTAPPPPPGAVTAPSYLVGPSERLRLEQELRKAAPDIAERRNLFLRYRRPLFEAGDRYLFLSSKPDKSDLVCGVVGDDDGSVKALTDIYSQTNTGALDNGLVRVPEGFAPSGALRDNLGDVLLNLGFVLFEWLGEAGTSYPGFLSPPDERDEALAEVLRMTVWRNHEFGLVLRKREGGSWANGRLALMKREGDEPARWTALAAAVVEKVASEDATARWQPVKDDSLLPDGLLRITTRTSPPQLEEEIRLASKVAAAVIDYLRSWIDLLPEQAARADR